MSTNGTRCCLVCKRVVHMLSDPAPTTTLPPPPPLRRLESSQIEAQGISASSDTVNGCTCPIMITL